MIIYKNYNKNYFLKSIAIGRCDIQLTFNGYTFYKIFHQVSPRYCKIVNLF